MISTDTCKLKNSSRAFRLTVKVILKNMNQLRNDDPAALHELVCLSYDARHRLWGNTGKTLTQAGFLYEDGEGFLRVHESVRDIVCSSIDFSSKLKPATLDVASRAIPKAVGNDRYNPYISSGEIML